MPTTNLTNKQFIIIIIYILIIIDVIILFFLTGYFHYRTYSIDSILHIYTEIINEGKKVYPHWLNANFYEIYEKVKHYHNETAIKLAIIDYLSNLPNTTEIRYMSFEDFQNGSPPKRVDLYLSKTTVIWNILSTIAACGFTYIVYQGVRSFFS